MLIGSNRKSLQRIALLHFGKTYISLLARLIGISGGIVLGLLIDRHIALKINGITACAEDIRRALAVNGQR